MHRSDNPCAMLVPLPFDGIGYKYFRRGELGSFSVKSKLGFINGECERPGPGTPQLDQWERFNDMVNLWILNALAKEVADSVEYVKE